MLGDWVPRKLRSCLSWLTCNGVEVWSITWTKLGQTLEPLIKLKQGLGVIIGGVRLDSCRVEKKILINDRVGVGQFIQRVRKSLTIANSFINVLTCLQNYHKCVILDHAHYNLVRSKYSVKRRILNIVNTSTSYTVDLFNKKIRHENPFTT